MFSNKPYLIRAFYDWIVDNSCTPYLVVNANFPNTKVPLEFVENGEITLNVSPTAVRELKISNDRIEFRASFSGVVHIITAPIKSILAIYAHENQQGMFFDYEDADDSDVGGIDDADLSDAAVSQSPQNLSALKDNKRPSHLKLVE